MIGTTAHNMVQKTDVQTLWASFAPKSLYASRAEAELYKLSAILSEERRLL